MADTEFKSLKFPNLPDRYPIPQIDTTLSESGAAADAKKTGDEIADLKSAFDLDSLTSDVKEALLALFENAAYKGTNGRALYNELYAALYYRYWPVTNTLSHCTTSNGIDQVIKNGSYSATITAEEGFKLTGATVSITMGGVDITSTAYNNGTISISVVTGALAISVTAASRVESLSAVFTPSENVYTSDELSSLKSYLVVTATLDDTSSMTVPASEYTLTGTLSTAGTQTITVSFAGQTTTFTVTVLTGLPSNYLKYDYIMKKDGLAAGTVAHAGLIITASYTLTSISAEFWYKAVTGFYVGGAIWGGRDGTGSSKSFAFYANDDHLGAHFHGGTLSGTSGPEALNNEVHHVQVNNTAASPSSVVVDGGSPVSIPWGNTNTYTRPISILTNIWDDSSASNVGNGIQCGRLVIRNLSGTIIADYLPVVRTSDSVIGMYDLVGQTFYTASTTNYAKIGNSACTYEVGTW